MRPLRKDFLSSEKACEEFIQILSQNGHGFKTNGGAQYVDLGDWTGETCFVDVDSCEQGNL